MRWHTRLAHAVALAGMIAAPPAAAAAVAAEITIDPTKTVCYPFKGLARSGWRLVGEYDRKRLAELAGAGKIWFIEHGQTLRCKYIDGGEIKADFFLNQQWWKPKP